jgi:hypothetical protein
MYEQRTASPVRAYGPTSRLALRSALPECLPLMGRRPAFFGFRSQGLSRFQPSLSQTHPRKHVTARTTLCWKRCESREREVGPVTSRDESQ